MNSVRISAVTDPTWLFGYPTRCKYAGFNAKFYTPSSATYFTQKFWGVNKMILLFYVSLELCSIFVAYVLYKSFWKNGRIGKTKTNSEKILEQKVFATQFTIIVVPNI